MARLRQPLTLDEKLCFSLYGASMAVGRTYKPILDRLGLTYPQYLVLSVLWERDGMGIGAIAERLDLEPSTVTPLVKRLEASGFVTRRRNPADERQVTATLTESGRAMSEESACLGTALVSGSGLTMDQLTALNREIRAFRAALAQSMAEMAQDG
ncbi:MULTISPECIES: MarR family winged helix-turn-helix transcriptional regulator [unclassified Aureimonas]|uniref:MarR family winged helix-turn-helix transcriptional regulator n=1 Tax=unclassified Aureimonas TaxID=2615206 RepID=UPI00071FB4C6|nr:MULTISPECIES: MarR family transcriptional regulator [unclassified Aureimonas]ALN71576.1 hypothetical protein M673_02555 [Aureimonas sp. AU20]